MMTEFQLNPIFSYLTEAESSSSSNFDENAHQIIWINFRTALIASSTSTSDESLDTMPTRVAAAESKEFACKPGHVWTATVPSATQTLTQNLVLQNSKSAQASSVFTCNEPLPPAGSFVSSAPLFTRPSLLVDGPIQTNDNHHRCHKDHRSNRNTSPMIILGPTVHLPDLQLSVCVCYTLSVSSLCQHLHENTLDLKCKYGEIYVGRQPGRERSVVAINVVKSIGESNQQLPTVSYIPKRKKKAGYCAMLSRFQSSHVFGDLTETEQTAPPTTFMKTHQIIWINFRTALIASSTCTSYESLDAKPTRVAAAEGKEFACSLFWTSGSQSGLYGVIAGGPGRHFQTSTLSLCSISIVTAKNCLT
ncbi:hypothetical protein T4B_12356 [Trichinella pseudospiralis]|uniref:Uncharacterized protein n=2 Tax=Trichinella pseudospiralis TaxID=6337 RepID=A0A0V1HX64_TRIPS|nr:hypothetical protein T4B_12356 [Trichinella pseudospiralis]